MFPTNSAYFSFSCPKVCTFVYAGKLLDFAQYWKSIFCLDGVEGFYIISNALTIPEQCRWVRRCVKDLSNERHTNLSRLNGPQPDLWSEACASGELTQFRKLRWANIGYDYDWSSRKYNISPEAERDRSHGFPKDLASFSEKVVDSLGMNMVPESGIVNFYNLNSTMGGHIDDAEYCNAPLVSLSLGNSCVFLLGGADRSVEPIPMILHSGDIIIQSGQSRFSVHGVARTIADSIPSELKQFLIDSGDETMATYIETARININV
eukprot:93861_1